MSIEVTKRTGLLAKKVGMTQVFDSEGNSMAVTLLKANENTVIAKKTFQKDGYNAVVIAFGEDKAKRLNKAQSSFFAKNKLPASRHVKEFRVSEDALLDKGAKISINHFVTGQKVDVSSKSIGKGFAGGMKRHNFRGLEATHGVSISHRSHGSTGQCQDPGKVFKGKKMAGHLGDERVTVQSVPVVGFDKDLGLIIINGSVPGKVGSIVEIKDAVKIGMPVDAKFPAMLVGDEAKLAEEAKVESSEENKN